jgi:predicted membrane protein
MTVPAANAPVVPARLVLGLVALILGLVFLADGAGLLFADSALALWPVGVVVVGLVVVLQPDTANRVVGAVLLVAGVWLLLNSLGIWSYAFWRTWPYLLVIVGAWMIYRVRGMRGREAGFAFLDRVDLQATSARFDSAELSAVLGSCRLDLRQVTLDEGTDRTIVDTFALFGTIELQVPAGWNVENRVVPLLGRVATPGPAAGAGPTMVVQGSVIGGRISVAAGR